MKELPPIVKRKKLFRCHRMKCQSLDNGRFESVEMFPACPQCGLSRKDEKFGDQIQRLVVVHFDPPTEFPGRGERIRACDPEKGIQAEAGQNGSMPNPWHAGTGTVQVVNCPDCKETPIYRYAVEQMENEDGPNLLAGAFERLQAASKG